MTDLEELGEFIKDLVLKMVLIYTAWVSFVMFLAFIGKSFGVRDLFVKVLILIFEWGKLRIEQHQEEQEEKHEEPEPVENVTATSGEGQTEEKAIYDPPELNHNDAGQVIEREYQLSSTGVRLRDTSELEDMKHEFELSDVMYFVKGGVEAIIDDGVTCRFSAEELPSWNLLTRTNNKHEFISYRLTILWFIGWVLRYIILFPFRFSLSVIAISSMIFGTAVIGMIIPEGRLRRYCYYRLSTTCYRIMGRAFSVVISYHNRENRAKGGGICVANHTSPIDIIILGCDNTYAMVGQEQGGFFGIMQRAFSRAETHIWFQRAEARDRSAVSRRLREHVEDMSKLPILIFPEGTCINNTSIMMFKKGSFETGGTIYPVAIKYDSRFADPFWNSSATNLLHHLLLIMTSWALVADVWYLPPEKQRENESSIQFANRVKAEIARQGGLVDLEWDGQLKRTKPKPGILKKQQENYSKTIKSD